MTLRKGPAVFALLTVAACGAAKPGGSTSSTAPSGHDEPSAASQSAWEPAPLPTDGAIGMLGLTAPEKPWDTMNHDDKEWYMVGKVHPVMRQVFQTFNAEKYEGEKFECAPCHGDNAKEKKYKMPNEQLSAVPAFGTDDWKAMENAKIVKFMAQRVTPSMAALIGKKPFDPATGEGYSCWACHPKQ